MVGATLQWRRRSTLGKNIPRKTWGSREWTHISKKMLEPKKEAKGVLEHPEALARG